MFSDIVLVAWNQHTGGSIYPKEMIKHYILGFIRAGKWGKHSASSNVLTHAMIFFETFKLLDILS